MALATAIISGKVLDLLGAIGVVSDVELTPATDTGALLPDVNGDLRIGPLLRSTASDGSLVIANVPQLPQTGYEGWHWDLKITPRSADKPVLHVVFDLTGNTTWGAISEFAVSPGSVDLSYLTQTIAARDAAVAAAHDAAAVGTTTDSITKNLIVNTSSLTRKQLDALYAANTGGSGGTSANQAQVDALAAQQTQLMSTTASIDELAHSVIQSGWWTNSATTAWSASMTADSTIQTLWTAPWPCQVKTLSMVREFGSTAASDTDYVTVNLRKKVPNGTLSVIATKTTKATGGEALSSRVPWNFSGASWDTTAATMAAGEFISVEIVATGTAAIRFPLTWTFRVVPL